MPAPTWAACSDVGRVRSTNQDSAFAGLLPGDEAWLLLAVADGVGGHQGGEWASTRAIEYLSVHLAEALAQDPPEVALAQTMEAASVALWDSARAGDGIPGAATTLVAALVRDGQAWWGNIGDSRLYLVSAGAIAQLSEDHSWVAERVRDGSLTPEEAAVSPHRNVVTRTVGFERQVSADRDGPLQLAASDVLVLCSDGLHGQVAESAIGAVVDSLDPEPAAARLIELANQAGGPDNITAIVCRAAGTPNESTVETASADTAIIDTVIIDTTGVVTARVHTDSAAEPRRSRRPSRRAVLLIGASSLLSGAAAAAAALWLVSR